MPPARARWAAAGGLGAVRAKLVQGLRDRSRDPSQQAGAFGGGRASSVGAAHLEILVRNAVDDVQLGPTADEQDRGRGHLGVDRQGDRRSWRRAVSFGAFFEVDMMSW